eukprot:Amastigsp_a846247_16.p2 type:complete len:243 gc:universal Amastigsp_a846247_16:904-176(-)
MAWLCARSCGADGVQPCWNSRADVACAACGPESPRGRRGIVGIDLAQPACWRCGVSDRRVRCAEPRLGGAVGRAHPALFVDSEGARAVRGGAMRARVSCFRRHKLNFVGSCSPVSRVELCAAALCCHQRRGLADVRLSFGWRIRRWPTSRERCAARTRVVRLRQHQPWLVAVRSPWVPWRPRSLGPCCHHYDAALHARSESQHNTVRRRGRATQAAPSPGLRNPCAKAYGLIALPLRSPSPT